MTAGHQDTNVVHLNISPPIGVYCGIIGLDEIGRTRRAKTKLNGARVKQRINIKPKFSDK
jgi:hypothetical protein